MRATTFFKRIIALGRTLVESVQLSTPSEESALDRRRLITIRVRPRQRVPRCGECGRKAKRKHGKKGKLRKWLHLGILGHPVLLVCRVYRVRCQNCGVRTMEVPWARVGSTFTRQFEDEVTWFAQRTDQTATSQYFGISWKTVGRIAQRVVEEKLDGRLLEGLRFIGVDEISYGRPKKFLTVVVNHEKGKIVWAGEGQSSATLKEFFDQLGPERSAKLEAVSMDMDEAYKKAVREKAPQAEIVYDRFHVVQLLSRAVDEVRREEVRKAIPEEKKELKSSRWPLLKNPWNLKPYEEEKLSTIQKTNRPLYRGYLLKESFQLIFNAETKDEARETFDQWYRWARRSTLEPFRKVAITMKEHIDGILRFIEKKMTNSRVEGFNSKIRMISHRAFGFHSAQALIAMIHLCCSGITITPLGAGHKFAT